MKLLLSLAIVLALLALAVDLACLPVVLEMVGFDGSLIWLGGTFVAGIVLARHLRRSLFERLRESVFSDEPESARLVERALFGVAGTLLMLPGPLTDLLGVLLLVPPADDLWLFLANWLARRTSKRVASCGIETGCDVIQRDSRAAQTASPEHVHDADYELLPNKKSGLDL